MRAAEELGFPVVVKGSGPGLAHKSERGLVRLNLLSPAMVEAAAADILAVVAELIVAPMVTGRRELIVGVHRDETFGMVVMIGVGGVLAEAVAQVACRLVPIDRDDAAGMLDDLGADRLLGRCRGEPAVDRAALADILVALSEAADGEPTLVFAELNPLVVSAGRPVPVDALVELAEPATQERAPDAHP